MEQNLSWKAASTVVTSGTTGFEIHKSYVLPTQCIYIFYVDLRTNSNYFPTQHLLVGLYIRYPARAYPLSRSCTQQHTGPLTFCVLKASLPNSFMFWGFSPLHGHSLLKDGRNSSSHTLRVGAALKERVQPIVPATAWLWVTQMCAAETSKHTWIYHVNPSSYYIYSQFNIHKFYVLPTQCICVFRVDLRTNSDYFPIQHWLVCITDGECLLRGTYWVFKCNSG